MRDGRWGTSLIVSFLLVLLGIPAGAQDVLELAPEIQALDVSPSRRYVAFLSGGEIEVWDLVHGAQKASFIPQGTPRWMRFAADERSLILGLAERRLEAWSLKGELTWSDEVEVERPGLVAKDGSRIIVQSRTRRSLRFYDPENGKLQGTLVLREPLSDWAMSPSGRSLALSLSSGRLQLWAPDGSRMKRELKLPSPAGHLQFSPNGRLLACDVAGIVRIFKTDTWQVQTTIQESGWTLTPLSFSPDGDFLAVYHFKAPSRYAFSLRELPSARSMHDEVLQDEARANFSPTGHFVAVISDRVRIYRLADADPSWNSTLPNPRAAWFAADEHKILVWGNEGWLRLASW